MTQHGDCSRFLLESRAVFALEFLESDGAIESGVTSLPHFARQERAASE